MSEFDKSVAYHRKKLLELQEEREHRTFTHDKVKEAINWAFEDLGNRSITIRCSNQR
jgi:hypothetical protein